MLLRTDPFRDLDRLSEAVFGTPARPTPMPLDAHRSGDCFVVEIDLPGVSAEAIDITVEHDVLTVRATRIRPNEHIRPVLSERPFGTFERRVILADSLDTERIEASYDDGVLTLRLPVADRARPRKVAVSPGSPASGDGPLGGAGTATIDAQSTGTEAVTAASGDARAGQRS